LALSTHLASGINSQKETISLKEELEMKNHPNRDSLQDQINRLGEEVALDINELEKKINAIIS